MEILSKPSVPVCELFSRSVKCFPRLTAIGHEDGVCTYDELDKLSTSFAMQLLRLGVVAGQHIPFLTRHGTLNIIALLGVLKLGASFVPMDKDTWSSQRIDHVLASFEGGLLVPTVSEGFRHPGYKTGSLLSLQSLKDSVGKTSVQLYSYQISCLGHWPASSAPVVLQEFQNSS